MTGVIEGMHVTSLLVEVTTDKLTDWQKNTEWQPLRTVCLLPNTQTHTDTHKK